jgi:hypothetical protein
MSIGELFACLHVLGTPQPDVVWGEGCGWEWEMGKVVSTCVILGYFLSAKKETGRIYIYRANWQTP